MVEVTSNQISIHSIGNVKINMREISSAGWVLDIGGGGEGIIGRLKNEPVIAVDHHWNELTEAPAGTLKVVANAAELNFIDETFQTATFFFSLMFIPEAIHPQVIREIYRVLQPEGSVHVWDGEFPIKGENQELYVGIHLDVQVASKRICTDFGRGWPTRPLTCDYYATIAKSCGFIVRIKQAETLWFYMVWEKLL